MELLLGLLAPFFAIFIIFCAFMMVYGVVRLIEYFDTPSAQTRKVFNNGAK